LKNLNSISNERLDERISLFLTPPSLINQNKKKEFLNARPSSQAEPFQFSLSATNLNKKENESYSHVIAASSVDLNHIIKSNENKDTDDLTIDTTVPEDNLLHEKDDSTQIYVKRWMILGVFCLITLLSAFNWIEYGIIQDVVISFYNESLPSDEAKRIDSVNWLSMIYMLAYIPLVFPAMFLLERKGLRLSCVLGALLTFIGAFIKCFAVRPDLFIVAIAGQTVCAIAQSFTLGIPARLSALWFGPDEIGLATSVNLRHIYAVLLNEQL
jgi:hypothetical protein